MSNVLHSLKIAGSSWGESAKVNGRVKCASSFLSLFCSLFFSFPLSWFSLLCGVALALSLTSVSPFVLSLSIYHTVKVERDVINLGE